MKTAIIIAILAVPAFYALRSLYRTLTGKQGCSCGSSKASKCPIKDKCKK